MAIDPIISKYMSELGRKGGNTTLKKHGKKYFSKISKIAKLKINRSPSDDKKVSPVYEI